MRSLSMSVQEASPSEDQLVCIARQALHEYRCSAVSRLNICCLLRSADQRPGHWRQVSLHVLPCTQQKAWQEFCPSPLADQVGALLLLCSCLQPALRCLSAPGGTMLHCCRSLYVIRRMTCRCPQTQLLLRTSEDRAVSAMQEPKRSGSHVDPALLQRKALTHPFFQTVATV